MYTELENMDGHEANLSGNYAQRVVSEGTTGGALSDVSLKENADKLSLPAPEVQNKTRLYNHRDGMGRTTFIEESLRRIRYLRPADGKISALTVQCAASPSPTPESVRWQQIPLENKTPWVIRMLYWLVSSVPNLATGNDLEDQAQEQWLLLCLKWPVGCIIILFLLLVPVTLGGDLNHNGFYDPVQYRYWGYPKRARNSQEERRSETMGDPQWQKPDDRTALGAKVNLTPAQRSSSSFAAHNADTVRRSQERARELDEEFDADFDGLPARHLRPRYLCVLKEFMPIGCKADDRMIRDSDPNPEHTGFHKVLVRQWVTDFPEHPLQYIVVSYTREHFLTTDEEDLHCLVANGQMTVKERDERLKMRNEDIKSLFQIAEKATRDANVPAFYIDFKCMDKATYEQDIHRISDVVRGAHSLVIALNIPVINRLSSTTPTKMTHITELEDSGLLRAWGARMWTVPEILLCSTEHRIKVYRYGKLTDPKEYAKRNFAVEAYKNPKPIRQLIDHYEGSLILTPLELVTIGLECLQSRLDEMLIKPDYRMWSGGDMSYALMALLRRRPKVNRADSAFEAFAKLSLANDSNKLLERLICMLPPDTNSSWHDMRDAWEVKLWDIDPRCQVAGIAQNQTVILDGAYGATIQWHSLAPVAFMKRTTFWRTALKYVMRGSPGIFAMAVGLLAAGVQLNRFESALGTSDDVTISTNKGLNGMAIAGIIILILSIIIIFASPYILLISYRGKLWSTQAAFFGIEGIADIEQVESFLFGFNHNRLKWSTNGSIMSQHKPNQNDECMPLPPDTSAALLCPGQRLFTLIDTYTMTATVFVAERPPTTVMICGAEGGMQRAVLCSYEWQTQTFKRDTVLRMKTKVLDRMFRVDKFRFSFSGDSSPGDDTIQERMPPN
ncbi:MAG: hypothetical protein M1818_000529 [Claussenomyces sp. TS43310]|nr:MAG: hypothetical protein M1818_000529 [Claussenomyces sp. TS43310]